MAASAPWTMLARAKAAPTPVVGAAPPPERSASADVRAADAASIVSAPARLTVGAFGPAARPARACSDAKERASEPAMPRSPPEPGPPVAVAETRCRGSATPAAFIGVMPAEREREDAVRTVEGPTSARTETSATVIAAAAAIVVPLGGARSEAEPVAVDATCALPSARRATAPAVIEIPSTETSELKWWIVSANAAVTVISPCGVLG